MPVTGATLEDDKRALLDTLPVDGRTIGNQALRRILRWRTDRYFAARNALADEGLVVRGPGYGGTIRRAFTASAGQRSVSVVVAPGADAAATIEASIKNELALYEPMRTVIAHEWAFDHRTEPLAVEVTALAGSKATGGLWSRPDIVSVEVRTFAFLPGKYLEVVTFEVKAAHAISIQAVYEALAHRRAATRSYVLLHVPSEKAADLEHLVADVASVARPHGIGVVTAADPGDYQTWDERTEAHRMEPDPERLDTFIAVQLSDKTRMSIVKAVK
jgi:hypothetical protein